ncbi:hypothetical protein ACVHNB_00510 [Streptomyces sp. YJ-C3]
MRATRRTFRTAAITTGAIAALAVPATAAFADTTPAPQPVTAGDQDQNGTQNGTDGTDGTDDQGNQGTTDTTDQNQGKQDPDQDQDQNARKLINSVDLAEGFSAKVYTVGSNGAEADIFKGGALVTTLKANGSAAKTTTGGYVFQLTPSGQLTADQDGSGDKTDPPVPGGWESKGTTNLGDGWSAKVDVNASARSARAEISQNGTVKGHLKAYIDDASTKIGNRTFTLSADGTITSKKAPAPKPKPDHKRVYVKTVKLADGSTAKIYKLGAHHYQADIYDGSTKLGTVDANGKTAKAMNNGLHIVLDPDGTLKSWTDGHPKPVPDAKRHYVKTVELADGVSVAKVYKLDPCHYQADIYAHGKKLDTLDAKDRTAYGQHNGLHVALKSNGTVTSWLDGSGKHNQHGQHGQHGQQDKKTAPVVPHTGGDRTLPQGGVKAGAENVAAHTSGSDQTPLIAAGAGAAALGAAGLGFTVYRRKHNN